MTEYVHDPALSDALALSDHYPSGTCWAVRGPAMTPAEARQALLDSLTVERFSAYRPAIPVSADGRGLLFTATREATEPVTATCVACGTRVPIDQSCPQCRATRATQARRARLRAASA